MENKFLKVDNLRIVIFFLGTCIISVALFWNINSYEATTAPDFVHNIVFSDLIAEDGTILYCNSINDEYNINLVGSRNFRFSNNNKCLTHGSFHGFIILLANIKYISPSLVFILIPLISTLCLYFIYEIAHILTKSSNISLAVTAASFFLSSYLFHVSLLFNNIPMLTFLFGSFFFMLKAYNVKSPYMFLLSSLFAGVTVWFRYEMAIIESALLIMPLAFSALSLARDKSFFKRIIIENKYLIIGYLLFFSFIITLLLLNYGTVGSLLPSGDGTTISLASSQYYGSEFKTYKILPLLPGVNFWLLVKNFVVYLVMPLNLLLVFDFLAIALFMNSKYRDKLSRIQSITLVTLFLIILFPFILYLGGVWSGVYENIYNVGTSYARYLLPSYIGLLILSGYSIVFIYFKRYFRIILVLFLGFFSFFHCIYTFKFWNSYNHLYNAQVTFATLQERYQDDLEKDGIIFVTILDKYLFPEYNTLIYSTLPAIDRVEVTADLIEEMIDDEKTVYMFLDNTLKEKRYDSYATNEYLIELQQRGIKAIYLEQLLVKFIYE